MAATGLISINRLEIGEVRVYSLPISAIYVGSMLVWENVVPTPIPSGGKSCFPGHIWRDNLVWNDNEIWRD